jgi:arylsulfatase A
VNKNMAMAIDLLPSFARLAGGKVPSDRIIDGMDISQMWTRGADSPHEVLYFFDGNDLAAVRDGRFKLVLKSYYRSGVIPFRQFAGVKLFDLQLDESESYDVGNRHPEVRARLLELAEKMEAATSSMATKPDPVFPAEGAELGPRLSAE